MKYFTFAEFSRSDTAKRLGIDNTIPESAKGAIEQLVDKVLDPLRESWGRPLVVTSGYRCPKLNSAVGGSKTSHHVKGMAADINTGNKADNKRLYDLVIALNLPFTQLINENDYSWVHISYDPNNVKRQTLSL